MTQPELPSQPLQRFCDLLAALLADKSWTDDVSALRFAASSLITLPGEPTQVARRLRETAQQLEQGARWFQPMKSQVRFVVAAVLMHSGLDAAAFSVEVERIEALFKAERLKSGTVYTQLACLLLMGRAQREGKRVDQTMVRRYGEIYAEMKAHHGFLTGQDDLPACALLAGEVGSAPSVAARCETFYEGLRDLGFKRGNALQAVSHILVCGEQDDTVLMQHFRALYQAFDDAGLWMNTGDYDEVAVLSFLPQSAEHVVARVLKHREHLQSKKPRPGRELGFSLACGTAFLELVATPEAESLRGARNVLAVQAILQAQQAAMIAAMAGATAAASAASSS